MVGVIPKQGIVWTLDRDGVIGAGGSSHNATLFAVHTPRMHLQPFG